MRAMLVVVPGVGAENVLEMSYAHDEEVVQALGSDRSHEPLGIGIRVWCSERSREDLGTLRSKDLVEATHVLRVAILG